MITTTKQFLFKIPTSRTDWQQIISYKYSTCILLKPSFCDHAIHNISCLDHFSHNNYIKENLRCGICHYMSHIWPLTHRKQLPVTGSSPSRDEWLAKKGKYSLNTLPTLHRLDYASSISLYKLI